jgi:DNA-binding Lrp family transcriptional regulator
LEKEIVILDIKLKEFGNEKQNERLDAVNKHGTYQAAADALGVSKTAINQSIQILKRNGALQGYSPDNDMTRTVPDGFKVKGISTYYNNEGKPLGRRERLNASGYPQGPVAFFQYIDAWRKSGDFMGLEFRGAAK